MDRGFERTLLIAWRRALGAVLKPIRVRLQWLKDRRRITGTTKRSYEEQSLIAWNRALSGIRKTIERRLDEINDNNGRGT